MYATQRRPSAVYVRRRLVCSGAGDRVERWDFDSGTMYPHWRVLNHGLYSQHAFGAILAPDFAVVDLLCMNGTCSDGSTLTGMLD